MGWIGCFIGAGIMEYWMLVGPFMVLAMMGTWVEGME